MGFHVVPDELREIWLQLLIWIYQHDENPAVNFLASRLHVPHYRTVHVLHEQSRSWRREADSVALSPVELEIVLDKNSIVGGDCDLKTGSIRYNPASWLSVVVRSWGLGLSLGTIDETELAFLATCHSANWTIVHEILHKFVRAQSTSQHPRWFDDLIKVMPMNQETAEDFRYCYKCFRDDYEESAVQYLEACLRGSLELSYNLLFTEVLVASSALKMAG